MEAHASLSCPQDTSDSTLMMKSLAFSMLSVQAELLMSQAFYVLPALIRSTNTIFSSQTQY